ncbi:hypothetical protein [Verrucomicrobium sp. 3C]|uniref:hypothetical protein n=1 Tax=Verrucomicrobium sp. 3C TaxID=1134055 RepID=UPI00037AE441|nr:hypothetical protein [Verrucomicrobium sp. 3C]
MRTENELTDILLERARFFQSSGALIPLKIFERIETLIRVAPRLGGEDVERAVAEIDEELIDDCLSPDLREQLTNHPRHAPHMYLSPRRSSRFEKIHDMAHLEKSVAGIEGGRPE